MAYVASHITENFKMHLFTTWSIPGVHQVFLLEHDKMYANDEVSIKTRKEWALETDSVNLKAAMCIPAMMPYDTNSPAWSESNFKNELVALSPLAVNSREDPANFLFLGYRKSPLGAGDMSPADPPGSPNAYSPTLPYVPQSPYGGMTSPFGTLVHVTSPFYDISQGATSLTYFLTSPALNLMSPCYLPTSPWYSLQLPSFSPTSLWYSPTGPSFVFEM
ncbi:hypothetical protein BKA82DRAFT_145964 [Pisolithus tinctorius]|uniref:Uncharacterized protein n=1 Tax=Pisolithus tinctorius Marx 270 TaxID=870435 RepID=A0A0C3K149_PISTI|nr:hypothetical protein BKA82DRAFT_145964 [Pisolithus tinctorius]KIO03312.1 hypothetical protein M404DRAFT_145964 [Pisolithus tinctorius Marx 270]